MAFVLGMSNLCWAQCPSPEMAAWPAHAEGQRLRLQWQAVPEAEAYLVWAQWRVPEAEVVHTLEQTTSEAALDLPASPEPWRLLKLQVELISLCKGGQRSKPTVLRQFQGDSKASCPAPLLAEGSAPVRDKAHALIRWQARDRDSLALRWSPVDGASNTATTEAVLLGPSLRLPLDGAPAGPLLIQAQRLCADKQRSAASYWLLP